MKKLICLSLSLLTFSVFSQKKELRSALKLMNQSFHTEALAELGKIEGIISESESK
mgnify:CR=1 FL=1